MHRVLSLIGIGLIMFAFANGQNVNELPRFIPPAPEAAALLKADNLSVGYTTGSPNINIPLYTLGTGGFSLPITLNYSSTGVKVDEIASMMGTGWTLSYGGVVSRTIMDMPDEFRNTSNCNLNTHNFGTPTYDLIQYLGSSVADKQSDIYSFSFGKYSGKFIFGLDGKALPLSKYNIKIEGGLGTGFAITTEDGIKYIFDDAETSTSRPSSGTGCKNDEWDGEEVATSWFMTKIVLPSGQHEINFTYLPYGITSFASSLSQTLSLTTSSENYQCSAGTGPTGAGCPVWGVQYTSCLNNQWAASKFISRIETSEGDKIEFAYDATGRSDLSGGVRLASLKVTNRDGTIIKNILFSGSYQAAVNATSGAESYRLFLDSLKIRSGLNQSANELTYRFAYIDYGNLPRRLSFAQDIYGYYNGKLSNANLLPKLSSGDVNYSVFNNGTGYSPYTFGDRSIDTVYAVKGLLNKIIYPTGGFDTIEYIANRAETDDLCGGVSVAKIKSYTEGSKLALERSFIYRYFADNSRSTFLIAGNVIYSYQRSTRKDGYFCQNENGLTTFTSCVGPQCQIATITSNINNPITTYGSNHVYHRVVQEIVKNADGDLGRTEHKYDYFMAGSLTPNVIWGATILNAYCHIVPDIFIGEVETNYYKNVSPQSPAYQLVKKISNTYENDGFGHYSSYVVRKNYNSTCGAGPGNTPLSSEVEQFDVTEVYIYKNTSRLLNTVEKNYDLNGRIMTDSTVYAYDNSTYNYATRTFKATSSGDTLKQRILYSFDYDTTTVSSNEAIGLRLLRRKGIHRPVETIDMRKDGSDYVAASNLTTFKQDKPVADKIYSLNISQPLALNSFTQSSISGGSLSKDSRYDERISFSAYDNYNNIIKQNKTNDVVNSYIWDYKFSFPVAECINADTASIAYASFESNGKGYWTYSGLPVIDASAPTGKKVYSLATGNISRSSLSSSATYIVSYWTKNTSAFSITGTQTSISGRTVNGWKYFEHKVTGQTQITLSGSGLIDELRLYPDKALMTTMTYEPMIGITSQCNVNNAMTYYEYDEFNRLVVIRDQDKNVVKKYCYNYYGQTENCNVYYNTEQTMQFQKQCSTGYTGNWVSYIIPANIYLSTISVDDANEKAMDDILANGQAYANAVGTCTSNYTCNYSNCLVYGDNKKCVNNVCETGVKVYTNSVWIGFHQYECTYHYEWSDGSWSWDYIVVEVYPCEVS